MFVLETVDLKFDFGFELVEIVVEVVDFVVFVDQVDYLILDFEFLSHLVVAFVDQLFVDYFVFVLETVDLKFDF